ncbi:tyrosine-type recombinase/integrase [Paenibacillus sp.]|jgi:integrase|uniref:tyrosine-type recombinase/integrase n=1 Tax=Paenibacillus sp. TaxID=58172 RepID=UPI00282EA379|nr:tyrosine-type recombinase/integrase [Paenibacillus sp.]MDR0269589.1 site-specific integrase [Paenibacillus sp.]
MAKGSFEKRGQNTWRLTVDLGFHPDGSRNRPRKPITIDDPEILRSKRKLDDYLEHELYKFKQEVESGEYIKPQKMTFEQFVMNEWFEKYANDPENLSPATLTNYEKVIYTRLIPKFGQNQIDEIRALSIVTYMKDLEKPGARRPPVTKKPLTEKQKQRLMEPLDAGTIAYIYRVLKNIFSRAVEWKVIKENPMDGVKKPSDKNAKAKIMEQRKNPQYYDEEEAQQVVDALYKESRKWRLLILGAMIGGCRRGELNGLEWPFVNFGQCIITIENNIPLTKKGKAVEKGPKSLASYRDIDMPQWYMDELAVYKNEWYDDKEFMEDKWLGEDREFVFHNGKGKPYYYQHPSKWWKRFCERHGIRYIKFHGLRHSSGTLLLEDEDESNFDSILMAIQRRLGHARLSTTTDTYVHVTKKVKKRTAGKFDKFARATKKD